MNYRAAVVGCGRMGSTVDDEWGYGPHSHTACYMAIQETTVVAASDVLEEKRNAYRERWGVETVYEDYREMLAKERPDVVSVTTHTGAKCEVVLDCVDAGVKGLFVEKPIAITLGEAKRMVEACEKAGVVIAVNCTRSWDPYYVQAQKLIQDGRIGSVRCIVGYCPGSLSHMGSHLIDIVRFFAGSPECDWVCGSVDKERAKTENDLPGIGLVWFKNGVRALINMLDSGAISVDLDIVGSSGRIRCGYNGVEWGFWEMVNDGKRNELVRRPFPSIGKTDSPNMIAIRDILNCIENGGEPTVSGKDAMAALEIGLAIRESERNDGARIYLPLKDDNLGFISK